MSDEVRYDAEAKALYVRILSYAMLGNNTASAVDHQRVLADGGVILDVDAQGVVVGVEVLGVEWPTSEGGVG